MLTCSPGGLFEKPWVPCGGEMWTNKTQNTPYTLERRTWYFFKTSLRLFQRWLSTSTGRQVARARNPTAMCSVGGYANSAEFQNPRAAHFLFCHHHLLPNHLCPGHAVSLSSTAVSASQWCCLLWRMQIRVLFSARKIPTFKVITRFELNYDDEFIYYIYLLICLFIVYYIYTYLQNKVPVSDVVCGSDNRIACTYFCL
jgi:hypothetical protein